MVLILLMACGGPAAPVAYERPVVVAERTVSFGLAAEGDVIAREIRLRNDGELPFGIERVVQADPEQVLGGSFWVEEVAPGTVVEAGEELVLDAWFTPEAAHDEDVVWIELFEDGETAWRDRAHPRMGIRLSGDGAGLPDVDDGQPVGGLVPDQVGVEPGDEIRLTTRAVGGEDVAYTAPDTLPCDSELCLDRAGYTLADGDGNQVWELLELYLWAEGELREPVLLDEPL